MSDSIGVIIHKDIGITLFIMGALILYSIIMIITGAWGLAILPSGCTANSLRTSLRTMTVCGVIMSVAFIANGICRLNCKEYTNKPGIYSSSKISFPLWLQGFVFIFSIVYLGSVISALSQFSKADAICTSKGYNTFKMFAGYFTIPLCVIVIIVMAGMMGYISRKERKAAKLIKDQKLNAQQTYAASPSTLEEAAIRTRLRAQQEAAAKKATEQINEYLKQQEQLGYQEGLEQGQQDADVIIQNVEQGLPAGIHKVKREKKAKEEKRETLKKKVSGTPLFSRINENPGQPIGPNLPPEALAYLGQKTKTPSSMRSLPALGVPTTQRRSRQNVRFTGGSSLASLTAGQQRHFGAGRALDFSENESGSQDSENENVLANPSYIVTPHRKG